MEQIQECWRKTELFLGRANLRQCAWPNFNLRLTPVLRIAPLQCLSNTAFARQSSRASGRARLVMNRARPSHQATIEEWMSTRDSVARCVHHAEDHLLGRTSRPTTARTPAHSCTHARLSKKNSTRPTAQQDAEIRSVDVAVAIEVGRASR